MRRGTLKDAIALAARAHEGQVDKAGAAYIGHPLRVAASVAAAGASEAAQIAALLHDVVEDGDVTLDALAAGFGAEVVSAVDALTRRAGESYTDFVLRAGSHPIGRLVKLADLADNLDPSRIASPTPTDLEREQRYRSACHTSQAIHFPSARHFQF